MAVYHGDFTDRASVASNFEVELGENVVILGACYTYEDYSGSAAVFFFDKATRKFYEVHGSHCSCYGLEGQWEPDEVTLKGIITTATNYSKLDTSGRYNDENKVWAAFGAALLAELSKLVKAA